MHIIATPKEFDAVKDYDGWPDGTTVVTCVDHDFFFDYQRVDGAWEVTMDHQEHDRDWKRGEEKKFLATLTRDGVIEFIFRGMLGDEIPEREYDTIQEYASDIFEYTPLNFAESYYTDEMDDVDLDLYTVPKLIVPQDADTAKVVSEIEECLEVMRRIHPRKKTHSLAILDHECSEFHSWMFYVHPDGTCERVDTRYSWGQSNTFKNLTEMVEFIKVHNYYE